MITFGFRIFLLFINFRFYTFLKIHKIERLVSIGKFRNYQAVGDVAFKKLTLFYGDNGGGKTTLTSIIRSLFIKYAWICKAKKIYNQATPKLRS